MTLESTSHIIKMLNVIKCNGRFPGIVLLQLPKMYGGINYYN